MERLPEPGGGRRGEDVEADRQLELVVLAETAHLEGARDPDVAGVALIPCITSVARSGSKRLEATKAGSSIKLRRLSPMDHCADRLAGPAAAGDQDSASCPPRPGAMPPADE